MTRSLLPFIPCFFLSFTCFSQNKEATDSLIVTANTQVYLEHFPNDSTEGFFVQHDSINSSLKAIRIKLTGKSAMGSVLEIFNPYETAFTYKAYLYNFKKKKYLEANVYPVQAKMGVREEWPFLIENILIKQFKIAKE